MPHFRGVKDIYNFKYDFILWCSNYFEYKAGNERLKQSCFGKDEKARENKGKQEERESCFEKGFKKKRKPVYAEL